MCQIMQNSCGHCRSKNTGLFLPLVVLLTLFGHRERLARSSQDAPSFRLAQTKLRIVIFVLNVGGGRDGGGHQLKTVKPDQRKHQ